MTGLVTCILIFILTNVSYLAVMTRAELLDANAVAVLWGDRTLGMFAKIIPITVVISTVGSANNSVFSGSR